MSRRAPDTRLISTAEAEKIVATYAQQKGVDNEVAERMLIHTAWNRLQALARYGAWTKLSDAEKDAERAKAAAAAAKAAAKTQPKPAPAPKPVTSPKAPPKAP